MITNTNFSLFYGTSETLALAGVIPKKPQNKPSIKSNLIRYEGIQWKHNGTDEIDFWGNRNFHSILYASREEHITEVAAGYPNLTNKSVSVKWVDEYKTSNASGASAGYNGLVNSIKRIKRMTDILPLDENVFSFNIEFSEERYNEEDKKSRFINDFENHIVSIYFSASKEVSIPGISIVIPYVCDIGAFVGIEGTAGFEYVDEFVKNNEDTSFKRKDPKFKSKASLCLRAGLKAEFFPGQENVEIYARGFGETCLVVEGEIKKRTNGNRYLYTEMFLEPLFFVADIHMDVYGYDVFTYNHRVQIFTKWDPDFLKTEFPID